jgi:hypothetical protein
MRPTAPTPIPPAVPDLELRGACVACGGDLSIRLGRDRARSVCRSCGLWTCPRIEFAEDAVELEGCFAAA